MAKRTSRGKTKKQNKEIHANREGWRYNTKRKNWEVVKGDKK